MKYIILTAPDGYRDTVEATLEFHHIRSRWWEPTVAAGELFTVRFLSESEGEEKLMDDLERAIAGSPDASMHTLRVGTRFPKPQLDQVQPHRASRGELMVLAEEGARSDSIFLLLVALSTIVAAIGMLQDNVAVVIGAMVIAPLLGPNLSSALAIALAEFKLARQASVNFAKGIIVAFLLSLMIGQVWPGVVLSTEILSRSVVSLDSPLLALASGTAAVLSMTSGVQSVLVGVMVAVALLPPLAAAGILLGVGEVKLCLRALLLFAINVSAINLSAHLTLFGLAVGPRTKGLSELAKKNTLVFGAGWLILLVGFSVTAVLTVE